METFKERPAQNHEECWAQGRKKIVKDIGQNQEKNNTYIHVGTALYGGRGYIHLHIIAQQFSSDSWNIHSPGHTVTTSLPEQPAYPQQALSTVLLNLRGAGGGGSFNRRSKCLMDQDHSSFKLHRKASTWDPLDLNIRSSLYICDDRTAKNIYQLANN